MEVWMMKQWNPILLCAILYVVNCELNPVVKTKLGYVRGQILKTRNGRSVAAFTSIPYAEPPVGDLRFKSPVPVNPWNGSINATEPTPFCVQRNPYIRQKEIVGQEDCLYLNIYTPFDDNSIPSLRKNIPVMVFIHGGGWMCGGSSTYMYGPQYLLDRDVILVTINYRLGPLGFLSTQDEHCPGNNGLKDQNEALIFIQKHIDSFGGDKNSVTIFGESAGGASVHFHMLSAASKGLFHKAISESGTALVPWAEAPPGEALSNAYLLAKLLHCPQAPSYNMLACLRAKDSYEIIDTEFRFYAWDYEPMTPFKAVVEPDLPGAFLTKSLRKITESSDVPWLTGLNTHEGCLKTGWIYSNRTRFDEFISGFDTIAPVTFYYEKSPYIDFITKKIRGKYLYKKESESFETGILDIYTDSYFAYPLVEAVELQFKITQNPIYLYELSYKASTSFSEIFGVTEKGRYICHADDLLYLFPIHFLETPLSSKDIAMSELIVTMWTNFATSGDPNLPLKMDFKWLPASSPEMMEYLKIKDLKPVMKNGLASRATFWGSLPLWHNLHKQQRLIDEL